MNTNFRVFNSFSYLLALSLMAFAGCGGSFDSTAHGLVTLDGKSVSRGMVSFYPSAGGPAVYGQIESDGSYSVHTGREEGLPSGEYAVSIVAHEAPTAAETSKGGPPPPGKAITPDWYRMKESSGLKFTVKPGKNEINLELSNQPPVGWKPGRGV